MACPALGGKKQTLAVSLSLSFHFFFFFSQQADDRTSIRIKLCDILESWIPNLWKASLSHTISPHQLVSKLLA
jgi:hypothetical protein